MKFTLTDITTADANALRDFADYLDGGEATTEGAPKRKRSSGGGRKPAASDTATNELGAAAGPMEATNVTPAPSVQTMPFPAPPVGAPAPPVQMPAPVQQPPASVQQQPPAPVQQPAIPAGPTWDNIRQVGSKVSLHPQYGQPYITEMMTRYGIATGQGLETLNPAYMQQFYSELAAIANTMP